MVLDLRRAATGLCLCLLYIFCDVKGGAEETSWVFERARVFDAIADGNFNKAIALAEDYNNVREDQVDNLTPQQYQAVWQAHKLAEIHHLVLLGVCYKFQGEYSRAKSRFDKADREIKPWQRRYATMLNQALITKDQGEQVFIFGLINDSNIAQYVGSITAFTAANEADRAARLFQESVAASVQVADMLGALAIETSYPLDKSSWGKLRSAEAYFRRAAELRETGVIPRFESTMNASPHGDNYVTLLRNKAVLHTRQAEWLFMFPDSNKDENGDLLLEKALDYIKSAEDEFSRTELVIKELRESMHEGSFEQMKDQNIEILWNYIVQQGKSGEKLPVSKGDVDRFFSAGCTRMRCNAIASADLQFVRAERDLAFVCREFQKGSLDSVIGDEYLDATEQRLLNASDMLLLLDRHGKHPFLVNCYAQLAVVSSLRGKLRDAPPDESRVEWIQKAEDVVKFHQLSDTTIQVRYLNMAKAL